MAPHRRKIAALFLLICVFPLVAKAEEMPLFYMRTQIVIVPRQVAPDPPPQTPVASALPWLKDNTQPQAQPPQAVAQGVVFDTEQRDARTVHTAGWINLSQMAGSQALMLVFPSPVIAAIRPVRDYSPYDILTVSEEGQILQILPNLVLADLQQPYQTPSAIKAIIYLRGGTCDTKAIAPGDRVMNKLFRVPTQVREIVQ